MTPTEPTTGTDATTGPLDRGLLLWLLEHGHVPAAELGDVLEHHAGLEGLSGTSGDLRAGTTTARTVVVTSCADLEIRRQVLELLGG